MRAPGVFLSYGARREVLAQIAPRYQEATGAQKMMLLDRVVEVTGYTSKYAILLLNQVPKRAMRIVRPRQPIYGSAVPPCSFTRRLLFLLLYMRAKTCETAPLQATLST